MPLFDLHVICRIYFYYELILQVRKMKAMIFWCHVAMATDIKTYFMNKNWNGREPLPYGSPDHIECLQAEEQFSLPSEISVCFRAKPMSWVHPRFPFAALVGFGTKQDGDEEMREGILLGIWRTGTWIGIKPSSSDAYIWTIGSPTQEFNFQVGSTYFHFVIIHVTGLAAFVLFHQQNDW